MLQIRKLRSLNTEALCYINVMKYALLLLLFGLLIQSEPAYAQAEKPHIKSELFFGLERKGKRITKKQWRRFLDTCVSRRFPDGFSVLDVRGQYYSTERRKLIREGSKLLILLHRGNPEILANIRYVTEVYRKAFQQESVLRVDSRVDEVRFD